MENLAGNNLINNIGIAKPEVIGFKNRINYIFKTGGVDIYFSLLERGLGVIESLFKDILILNYWFRVNRCDTLFFNYLVSYMKGLDIYSDSISFIKEFSKYVWSLDYEIECPVGHLDLSYNFSIVTHIVNFIGIYHSLDKSVFPDKIDYSLYL